MATPAWPTTTRPTTPTTTAPAWVQAGRATASKRARSTYLRTSIRCAIITESGTSTVRPHCPDDEQPSPNQAKNAIGGPERRAAKIGTRPAAGIPKNWFT